MLQAGEIEVKRGVKRRGKGKWYYDEVVLAVLIHYLHYMTLVIFANPRDKQVLGLHQPQGSAVDSGDAFDCGQLKNISYRNRCLFCLYANLKFFSAYPFTSVAFPSFLRRNLWEVTVWRRPFICEHLELFDEQYLDLHCPKAEAQKVNIITKLFRSI